MAAFHGNLLIGGMALRDLQGELDDETPASDSDDWLLVGRLHISPVLRDQLQLGRRYRLLLDDGRSGPVVLDVINSDDTDSVAEFRPEIRQ